MGTRLTLAPLNATEHEIQDAILRFLAFDKRIAWARRMNTGAHTITETTKDGRRTKRFVRYGFPGCSDILGQLIDGRLLAIEVKRHDGKPTPMQEDFLAKVTENRGIGMVARSIDDVRLMLDAIFSRP